jgi:predicted solute-binding protein
VQDPKSPRIGCVKYLNARPLIRGWPGTIDFDHPSALCQRLSDGELDVALVSSFEFLRNPIYSIVDGVAIASDGPVYSVFVASVPGTSPGEIEIDPASRTGVAMLRYLMAERNQMFTELEMPKDNLSALSNDRARLLIGDQAIRFRQKFGPSYEYWDLGDAWRGVTGLPFVYALWLIRPEASNAKAIANSLRALREDNLAHLKDIIAAEKEFDHAFCTSYYRDCLRFGFGEREKEGLSLFQKLCAKHGLLPEGKIDLRVV